MSSPAREFRLKDTRRIEEIFDRGDRSGDSRMTVLGLPNGLDRTRIAFAVGRRQHGVAVRRNRMRRVCREAFRAAYHDLPVGWDFVLLPRRRSDQTVESIAASLGAVTRRLAAKRNERERDDNARTR